jgi:hypothetical protein
VPKYSLFVRVIGPTDYMAKVTENCILSPYDLE